MPAWPRLLRDIPDFPKPGVLFKDITPLLADGGAFAEAVADMAAPWRATPPDAVAGIESRGFILGAALALQLGCGFVPVRKPGKLPGDVYSHTFALEYGHDTLTVSTDAVLPGARVLVIDDVLATGGTIAATAELVKQLGAELVHVSVLMELGFLPGRRTIAEHGITTVSAVVTV